MVWSGVVWLWYGMVWYGMVWCGMVWYGWVYGWVCWVYGWVYGWVYHTQTSIHTRSSDITKLPRLPGEDVCLPCERGKVAGEALECHPKHRGWPWLSQMFTCWMMSSDDISQYVLVKEPWVSSQPLFKTQIHPCFPRPSVMCQKDGMRACTPCPLGECLGSIHPGQPKLVDWLPGKFHLSFCALSCLIPKLQHRPWNGL